MSRSQNVVWALALGIAGLTGSTTLQAAEVFAEPVKTKGSRAGYALTAFASGEEDAITFTLDLPKGLKDVDTSKCGSTAAGIVSRCLYAPSSGKLAVLALRLDGQPIAKGELALGKVTLPAAGGHELMPVEVENVNSARRKVGRSADATGSDQRRER